MCGQGEGVSQDYRRQLSTEIELTIAVGPGEVAVSDEGASFQMWSEPDQPTGSVKWKHC